jgi:hypothetical protein
MSHATVLNNELNGAKGHNSIRAKHTPSGPMPGSTKATGTGRVIDSSGQNISHLSFSLPRKHPPVKIAKVESSAFK